MLSGNELLVMARDEATQDDDGHINIGETPLHVLAKKSVKSSATSLSNCCTICQYAIPSFHKYCNHIIFYYTLFSL